VIAIPDKRFERAVVSFLAREEMEALLASPEWSAQLETIALRRHQSLRLSHVTLAGCNSRTSNRDRDEEYLCLAGAGVKKEVWAVAPIISAVSSIEGDRLARLELELYRSDEDNKELLSRVLREVGRLRARVKHAQHRHHHAMTVRSEQVDSNSLGRKRDVLPFVFANDECVFGAPFFMH
jgi:hypothetical protein